MQDFWSLNEITAEVCQIMKGFFKLTVWNSKFRYVRKRSCSFVKDAILHKFN